MERKNGEVLGQVSFTSSSLYTPEQVAVYQEIGERFGVETTITAAEGKHYRHTEPVGWEMGHRDTYEGIVPKGRVYARLDAQSVDKLELFYKEAEELLAKQREAKKPQ